MRMPKILRLSALLTSVLSSAAAFSQPLGLGKPISASDFAEWNIDIEPDGAGLPPGSGTSDQGAPIFADNCAACHGDGGRGAQTTTSGAPAAPAVVSDIQRNGIDDTTLTIANYWPYATTLFDYIRRSMPWTSPRSLTDEQVYALTAYILAQNKLIDSKQAINAQTLPKVQMPNRDGFTPRFPNLMPHVQPME
jgi:S-disulfanyl-L-cysteine oxidoreductase SoxD